MRMTLSAACLILSALTASAQWIDSVPTSGRAIDGEIQEITSKEIKIVVGGGVITVTQDQIKGPIVWDEQSIPGAMSTGKAKFANQQYAGAITDLTKAMGSSGTRSVLKQEIAFFLAESYRLSGDFTNAAATYQKILKDFPNSYYLGKIYSNIVDCHMYSDPPNYREALAGIATAAAKARELGFAEDFIGDLKLKEARVYDIQRQLSQASAAYQSLVNHKTPRIAWAAQAGLGRCQLLDKQNDKARMTFQKVIDNCEPGYTQTLAIAYNGLGEVYLAQNDGKVETVKEALMCFLRTTVLYPPGPSDLTEEHAKGMMLSAKSFQRLAKMDAANAEKYEIEYHRLKARFQGEYSADYPNFWALIQKEAD